MLCPNIDFGIVFEEKFCVDIENSAIGYYF